MSRLLIDAMILRRLARGACLALATMSFAHGLEAQQSSAQPVARPAAEPANSSVREPAAWIGTGPRGATLRCRDGSYPAPRAPDSACDGKGGVAVRFPLKPVPGPNVPSPVARPAAAPSASSSATGPTTGTTTATPNVSAVAPSVTPQRAVQVPSDATLLCRDGTIIRADTVAARCGSHGGLRARFPRRSPPR